MKIAHSENEIFIPGYVYLTKNNPYPLELKNFGEEYLIEFTIRIHSIDGIKKVFQIADGTGGIVGSVTIVRPKFLKFETTLNGNIHEYKTASKKDVRYDVKITQVKQESKTIYCIYINHLEELCKENKLPKSLNYCSVYLSNMNGEESIENNAKLSNLVIRNLKTDRKKLSKALKSSDLHSFQINSFLYKINRYTWIVDILCFLA